MPNYNFCYCDANIFLSYFNENPHRITTLQAFFEEIQRNDNHKIVTSIITKVEVAWTETEKYQGKLSHEEKANIDAMWNDASLLEFIEFNDNIAMIARDLMRSAKEQGWVSIRPLDAIHLASAKWVNATDFITYDTKELTKYSQLIGIKIHEPILKQGRLL